MLRWYWPLMGIGLLARLATLDFWGTFDTEVQKAWAARAATSGVADIYGPPDSELLARARAQPVGLPRALLSMPYPRTTFEWEHAEYFVDYPPGSVLVLAAAGSLYGRYDAALRNRRAFNAAINLAPLLASCAIALLLFRSGARDVALGRTRALAFWLNPAVLLAAPILGYQDTIFGALALAALLALPGQPAAATAMVVAAGLVKPQGALLLPLLAARLLVAGEPQRARLVWRASLAGIATAAVILSPWWYQGYLLSALDGCRRPLAQPTLAPLGFNVWWIAGWWIDARSGASWPLARIVSIREFAETSGVDPRFVGRALTLTATAVIAWWAARRVAVTRDRNVFVVALVLQVHAYALFATSVHENHTLLAVIVAPLLLGARRGARGVVAAVSTSALLNLFLTAGFGRRITSQAWLVTLRLASGVDLSVLVAVGHVVLGAALAVWAARSAAPTSLPSARSKIVPRED